MMNYTFKIGVHHNQSILLDACPLITKLEQYMLFEKKGKKITPLLQIQVNFWIKTVAEEERIQYARYRSSQFTDKHKQGRLEKCNSWKLGYIIWMNQSFWWSTSWINSFIDYVFDYISPAWEWSTCTKKLAATIR